jgi:hypothetical protein
MNTPVTLKAFFCDDEGKPVADCLDAGSLIAAANEAASGLPRAALPGLAKAMDGALEGLFTPRLDDILARSWGKLQAVSDALKATATDPAALAVVPLLDHAITSKHTPKIDLVVAEQALCTLAFDITLGLQLKGVLLQVKGGRIAGLTAGACEGQGTLALAGKTLISKKTPAFALPGRLDFAREATDTEA